MRRRLSLLAVTAATLVAAAAPSQASAAAWNEGIAWLEYPVHDMGSSCVERRIYLRSDYYRWKVYVVHPSYPHEADWYDRNIYLRAGNYLWKDCIDDAPDTWGEYIHCSWLDEGAPGGAAKLCHWTIGTPGGRGDAFYEFGSQLGPQS